MAISKFPPIEDADDDGLLALGGDLEVESLLLAYRSGIFPWPLHPKLLAWFAPPRRTLLFLDRIHIPRSLKKAQKKAGWTFAFDRDFQGVISACASLTNRGSQGGTWITPGMVAAYTALHHAGHSHSIECYENQELAGGLYGVSIGGMFAGESMFYRRPNASKAALVHLCGFLRERGAEWIDCQVMTPTVKSLGAVEVERSEFMQLLQEAISREIRLFAD